MDVPITEILSDAAPIQNVVEHKPCLTDTECFMPPNYTFSDKLVTIMLHSHDLVAFARNHNNQFLIDFLNYNKLTWEKSLKISINILTTNFIACLGPPNFIYFISLDPKTFIIRFDEDSWTYQTYIIFEKVSKVSFINANILYLLMNNSVYCIDLYSVFDENFSLSQQVIQENDILENKDNSKVIRIQKYINLCKSNFLDQVKIFATQQFYHYSLIYTSDINTPLLIFDTLNKSFCFEKELSEVTDYFKRKPSPVYPLNDANFMQVPGKSNCFYLFHDFDSSQNTFIPINKPLIIKSCQNQNNEQLTIITVSVKRISPIIAMFSLPGEGFNFLSVSNRHYYQFYTSRGLLSIINHSKSIINSHSKQKIDDNKETKDSSYINYIVEEIEKAKPIDENLKIIANPKTMIDDNANSDVKNEKKEKPLSLPIISPIEIPNFVHESNNNQSPAIGEETINLQNLDDKDSIGTDIYTSIHCFQSIQKDTVSFKNDKYKVNNENKSKIGVVLHFLSLGPLPKVDLPNIEIDFNPEYHLEITTPIIPHCFFIKSVEVIVGCVENDDILSFYLKPSSCIIPQKVNVKCKPDSSYKVILKVSNGYQSAYSDSIDFKTPNPGRPPKVEDFIGTYASDDTYIFKWSSIPDTYNVNSYILEGSLNDLHDVNSFKFVQQCNDKFFDISPNEPKNFYEYSFDDIDLKTTNAPLDDGFEFIIDLPNQVSVNDLCGAKLKISIPYKQFRIRAANSIGAGEPSEPCLISKKISTHQKKAQPASSRISKEHILFLNEKYRENPNPNLSERNEMAETLSLPYQTVNSWFARKRHADKVNGKQQPP
ncbi:hypothetical protein M9Y10_001020 [Tritrichomonas musculus]|uniref:Homeobox domain-containing protein n=1 Tax=Tritrichomonas musculus TaxID=1915356 RepID=A0ABR2L6Q8_9EUKA